MQTIRHYLGGHYLVSDPSPFVLPPDTTACIGAFDGLHAGHRALFVRGHELASRLAVVTFEPHPSAVLAPERAPPLLQTEAQRARVCNAMGVDELVLLPFDPEVATLDPEAFVRRFLIDGLAPRAVVVGDDFHFGRDRSGSTRELEQLCMSAGITFASVAQVRSAHGERISSTAIRKLVLEGRVGHAADMLGRWYAVEGKVRHGAARGKSLGFPTANVASENAVLPRRGVYAAILSVVDPDAELCGHRFPSVANVGENPTFQDGPATAAALEVHALDVDLGEALYERRIEVGFVARLRDEKRFKDASALAQAIQQDIAKARPLLDDDSLARLPPPTIKGARRGNQDRGQKGG